MCTSGVAGKAAWLVSGDSFGASRPPGGGWRDSIPSQLGVARNSTRDGDIPSSIRPRSFFRSRHSSGREVSAESLSSSVYSMMFPGSSRREWVIEPGSSVRKESSAGGRWGFLLLGSRGGRWGLRASGASSNRGISANGANLLCVGIRGVATSGDLSSRGLERADCSISCPCSTGLSALRGVRRRRFLLPFLGVCQGVDSSVSSWLRGSKGGETSFLTEGVGRSGPMGLPVLGSLNSGGNLIDIRGTTVGWAGRGAPAVKSPAGFPSVESFFSILGGVKGG